MHSNPIAHVLIDRSIQCTMRSLRMSVARLRIWWGVLVDKNQTPASCPDTGCAIFCRSLPTNIHSRWYHHLDQSKFKEQTVSNMTINKKRLTR
ncbi:hypothetical protein CEXT_453001 [Caerostris extrusa]|uniref:C2H2-type domain-containing protein n=1 Tax=Caerostris extrusa TaxID=172846 RepID=A0AAV4N326_CAEEX|nr:hypothetical protein CEXT_453001 [Caerostris extrusa]